MFLHAYGQMHATPFLSAKMVATMIGGPARSRFDEIAQKWRVLAEKRWDKMVELHVSGRWSTYFEEQKFKRCMREAAAGVERWNAVAPRPSSEKEPKSARTLPNRRTQGAV
jgi:hypothetical protein